MYISISICIKHVISDNNVGMKFGIRVVRGPDWSGGNQDGGEGHLGTMVAIPTAGKVLVIWDTTGEERMYSAGRDDKFELRIYDNGPIGKWKIQCDI